MPGWTGQITSGGFGAAVQGVGGKLGETGALLEFGEGGLGFILGFQQDVPHLVFRIAAACPVFVVVSLELCLR